MYGNRATIFCVGDIVNNFAKDSGLLYERYNVASFNSGLGLLDAVEKEFPDLILIDEDTLGICEFSIEAKFEYIPVIVLRRVGEARAELRGIEEHTTMPYDAMKLCRRIDSYIELSDYRKRLSRTLKYKTGEVSSLKDAFIKAIAALVEIRDNTTGEHIEKTRLYLSILLDAMKTSDVYKEETAKLDMELVLVSSLLHDVGKITISDAILQKPGTFTQEEAAQMQKHAALGGEIIESIKERVPNNEFLDYAHIFALSHHEKWDGSGYPKGLAGEEIPLLGRVMAIADVYDALVSARPYKKALTHAEAAAIIKEGRGTHFDPVLVDLFLSVSHEFEYLNDQQHGVK